MQRKEGNSPAMMSPLTLEGQTLGKYRVLEPLGRGGMAQVYRAYHPQLDRFVAIKILRGDLVDEPEFQARFRREARAVAALRHPHIVQIFDFDVQDEYYYMVMELLEGDSLKAILNRYRSTGKAMPLQDLVRIMLDVLDGLAYAHGEGITHRDIKPANILLTRRGEAVITDFGIAQIVGGTSYTMSGALMGTPHYMAPEQGWGNQVDHRSDLYSAGVVLYEMFTGRPPFEADTPLAILMKHLNDPLPIPRKPALAIPAPFEQVLLKALAKEPGDRYQSALEMSTAVQAAAVACTAGQSDLAGQENLDRVVNEPAGAGNTPVYSGAARQRIPDAHFAEDETDAALGQHLGKASLITMVMDAALGGAHVSPRRKTTRAALTGVGVVAGGNVLAAAFGIFSGSWALFQRGWPAELLLVSVLLLLLMSATASIWLLIPAGLLLGNGFIFAYFSLSGNWGHWAFLWPLEPLLVLGSIGLTILLGRRPDQARPLAAPLGIVLTGLAAVMILAIGWASLIIGALDRLFQK